MNIRIAVISLVLVSLVMAAGAAQPLAERLPAQTLAYIGWAGTETLEYDGSIFGQFLKEPALGRMMAALRRAMCKESPAWTDKAWAMARLVWKRPLAAALLDVRISEEGLVPVGALLVDLGDKKDAFAAQLDDILHMRSPVATMPFTDATVASVTYKVLERDDAPEIAFGYIGNVFFCTVGRDAAKLLIDLKLAQSLKANKAFAACMGAASGENELAAWYGDLGAIGRRLEPLVSGALAAKGGPTPQRLLETLGLSEVTALAGATRILDKGMYTKVRLFSPAPHRGVLLPLAGAVLSPADLAGVPADADFVVAAKISPAALYAEIRDIVKTLSPPSDADITAALTTLEAQLGLSIETDLLNSMGDT
ncbi:MAG: hypothetical protein J7M14_03410, partial [Planctomycetes bacterium]|nr:hypothetical protein [Planctomycetota bacterium]